AVVPQATQAAVEVSALCGDSPTVSVGAKHLGWVEGECSRASDGARRLTAVPGAMRLCAVLHKSQAVFGTDLSQAGEVGTLAIEVHRKHAGRTRTDRGLYLLDIDEVSRGMDIHEHGRCAHRIDRDDRRCSRVRDCDHLIAWLDTSGTESQLDGVSAVVDTHAVIHVEPVCELLLKAVNRFAHHKAARGEHPVYCRKNTLTVALVLRKIVPNPCHDEPFVRWGRSTPQEGSGPRA